jgi:hypothetical protein
MANAVTMDTLNGLQSLITEGRIVDFYDFMDAQGYSYASWAKGVANGSTLAGVSALDFMTNSAMMGGNGKDCRNLSAADVSKIKIGMAQAYLDALRSIVRKC